MKGLEAFEEIKRVMNKLFSGVERSEKALNIIEKELKALEILRQTKGATMKCVDKDNNVIGKITIQFNLTKDEYDLLKEVML